MRKQSRKTIKGVILPDYVIDILTGHVCEGLLQMSILRENTTYVFSYDDIYYEECKFRNVSMADAAGALKALFRISRDCRDCLITPDQYLIEPSVLRKRQGSSMEQGLKLMFYPDVKRRSFSEKVLQFIDTMTISEEVTGVTLDRVRKELERGDAIKAEHYLDLMILRMEARS